MPKIIVSYIILNSGEYLYNYKTGKLYECKSPYKYIGKIKNFIKKS